MNLRAAVDLGAGGGRIFVGGLDRGALSLCEVHRFAYAPRPHQGHLRWDAAALLAGLRDGVTRAREAAERQGAVLDSIGVDSWGVDYGLVTRDGRLLEDPICYRDARTLTVPEATLGRVSAERLFSTTGIQRLRINTVFQLVAHVREGLPPGAARLLMIPDLCHHFLCGSMTGELTNASTTQLLNAERGEWDEALFRDLGLPLDVMPALRPAGAELGSVRADLRAPGSAAIRVIQPATHDTASAVAGTPLSAGWAYISSGTWSLVGIERRAPIRGADAFAMNFTNERGASGTVRFLKNVMGLWILDRCYRAWSARGMTLTLADLAARAAAMPGPIAMVYPDDPRFFNPPDMAAELHAALSENGARARTATVPDDPVSLTRIVIDSLALRYASVLSEIERLTGERLNGVHVVGGGSLNDALNQATANASGRSVLAGPVEATAVGNLFVQSVAAGDLPSVDAGRRLLAEAIPLRRFEPCDADRWRAARDRYREMELEAGLSPSRE